MNDIFVGALAKGVNCNTLIALNSILVAAILSLLALLALSIISYQFLVPHVIVLLVLAALLTASINWLVLSMGLADPAEQEKELFGVQASEPQQSFPSELKKGN